MGIGKGLSVCFLSEVEYGFEMFRFRIAECFSEVLGSLFDRFSEWFEGAGVCVLGSELPKLFVRIYRFEGILADEMEFIPESVEMLRLVFLEH